MIADDLVVRQALARVFSGRIQQVFAYVTNKCQLNCRQCLYKPLLRSGQPDIGFEDLSRLLNLFRDFGAYKLSFLGGEPTLYHDRVRGHQVGDLVTLGIRAGFDYVRMDTNGQFDPKLLDQHQMQALSELTFSLDGHTEDTNDVIRGRGTLSKCLLSIEKAVALGYKVQVTTCVHNVLCPDLDSGLESIDAMIRLAEGLGVHAINFHPILAAGVPRDNWLDGTNIPPTTWIGIYHRLRDRIASGAYSISVRVPMRYVELGDYLSDSDLFNYCPVRLGERALIMPDGSIKICAFEIGTPNAVASFRNGAIIMAEECSELRKLSAHSPSTGPCHNQCVADRMYVPLCMSYKPNQDELVWSRRQPCSDESA